MFLNQGSVEPWGYVRIPQGFREDNVSTKFYKFLQVLTSFYKCLQVFTSFQKILQLFPNLLEDFIGKMVAWTKVPLHLMRHFPAK